MKVSPRVWRLSTPLCFWSFFGLHLVVALFLKFALGVDIQAHPLVGDWDWFYHTIPTANLLEHPLTSIWYLHAQPPVFNLLGALVMQLAYPHHLQVLQYLYIVMGALAVAMAYPITLTFAKSVRLALLVTLFLSLNPVFFLYEAYALYDILTVFEVTTMIFLLCLASTAAARRRMVYLIAFLGVSTLLTLTRSLFHLVFLLPCVLVACLLAGKGWRWIALVGLCCGLLTVGWYAKNEQQVGVFGGSSWLGISLWRIASVSYSAAELGELANNGVIDTVAAELPSFSRPSEYVRYGFDQRSANPEWSRDDFNNINIPAIAAVYQENALRLIAHDPVEYLRMVITSFVVFCHPASKFADIAHNTVKIAGYEAFYADILQLHVLFKLGRTVGSILLILLPLTLGLTAIRFGREWRRRLLTEMPVLFTAFLVAYTVALCCLVEFGENFRFKLAVEIPMWAWIATTLYQRYWPSRSTKQ